jgi:hypothetical protein
MNYFVGKKFSCKKSAAGIADFMQLKINKINSQNG